MKLSSRISAGVTGLLGALFVVALPMFFWQALDQRFHLVSDHMRDVAGNYEFRLLGGFLLAFTPFCLLLEGIWWFGRKLRVPYFVLVLICLALIVIAYFWVAGQLRGTLRG
jgi:hypothetical protein